MGAGKVRTGIRQEQIAGAALRVVDRDGLRGLSVAAVAREVGIVPSAIYRHYRSKDHVVGAVLALVGGRLQGNVRAVREETAEPLERLHRLLGRLAGQFDDEEDDDNDDDPRRGGEPRSGAMLAQPPQLISPTQRV